MVSVPIRSGLHTLSQPETFWWATGLEDTFITAPWPATGRTLDEYDLTQHYARWHHDLGLVASLGVKTARYGIPWHLIEPRPGEFDWRFADQTLERLLDLGVDPIVDLVHYGLPPWLEGAYLNPEYPQRVASYASRVAERFRDRVVWYTPLNEPRITAWYCGRLGWWPPYRRGWRGFVAVMIAIARGIVETVRALSAVDPQIVPVHVDATDLFDAAHEEFTEEAARRQEIVFLALDLVSGRVGPEHSLWSWLLVHGATEADLRWFQDNAIDLPLIGLNLYPMFTRKILRRTAGGRRRMVMPYASEDLIVRLGRLYHERYGVPLLISETASQGSVARRRDWLDRSVAAVGHLRREGVPMIGYTWWPMFAMVSWAYRQGRRSPADYLVQMGLWNLDADLDRISTELVDAYQGYVAGGSAAVGRLAQSPLRRSG